MIKAGIITISDRASSGERIDLSGPIIKEILKKFNELEIIDYIIISDEEKKIAKELKKMTDILKLDLIFTTGGTGLSDRDVTPEATKKIIQKEIPGISETMRQVSLKFTPNAILS
ncbi:MAG: MogA/MoaB family molybdenum cofactor biosynthesis protein, partial [Candidatus Omnitrophota bacterium]